MKHLDQFINEAKATYELPEDFEEKTKSILDSLIIIWLVFIVIVDV